MPAVELGKFGLKLRRAHAVFFREIRLGVKRVLLVHDFHEALVAHDDRAQHFVIIVGIVVLLQHGQAFARRDFNGAARRLNVACQQL